MVLEANVDDLTGEVAGHAIDALLAAGAVDAWAVPITMKKGRPALTISALAPAPRAEAVASAMLRETTMPAVQITPPGGVDADGVAAAVAEGLRRYASEPA